MKLTKWRLAAVGVGVSLLAAVASPANALATHAAISDTDGNDFDPLAVYNPVDDSLVHTLSDGSMESTDFVGASAVKLETDSKSLGAGDPAIEILRATFTIDGVLPAEGSTANPGSFDGPHPAFVGGSFRAMFNNKNKQTNGENLSSGCQKVDGTRVKDQDGHWADGYFKYIGFGVTYDGTQWNYIPEAGTLDPSPDGGFGFYDIENDREMNPNTNVSVQGESGQRYSYSVTTSGGNTTVVVEISGLVRVSDVTCATPAGYYEIDLASSNAGAYSSAPDPIANVFGLSTNDTVVVLPVTVPLSLVGEGDIKSVGGFVWYSDTHNRNAPNATQSVYWPGELGVTDNLGDGPTCPTPTFGGRVPVQNPLWQANQNQPCQIDDDAVGNMLLSEWLPSGFDFTASF